MASSEKRKQELVDKHRDMNVDYGWWEYIYEDFIARLAEAGLSTETSMIHFSGFDSQGDGAQFELANLPHLHELVVDAQKWKVEHLPEYMKDGVIVGGPIVEALNAYADTLLGLFETWLLVPRGVEVLESVRVTILLRGRSNHSGGMDIWLEGEELDDAQEAEVPAALKITDDTIAVIEYAIRRIADALYTELETEYEYLTSDEQVWEAIVANELDTPDEDDEENDDVATLETGSQPAGDGDGQGGPAIHAGGAGLLHQCPAAIEHRHEPVHQHAAG
jgi:hypothetical protein